MNFINLLGTKKVTRTKIKFYFIKKKDTKKNLLMNKSKIQIFVRNHEDSLAFRYILILYKNKND